MSSDAIGLHAGAGEMVRRKPEAHAEEREPRQWAIDAVFIGRAMTPLIVFAVLAMMAWHAISFAGPKWGTPMVNAVTKIADTSSTLAVLLQEKQEDTRELAVGLKQLVTVLEVNSELSRDLHKKFDRLERRLPQ